MQLLRTARSQKFVKTRETKAAASEHLHHLPFDNSLQANIISTVSDGKIIEANIAAFNLLGYSKKELQGKKRNDIFRISEKSYIKMVRKRTVSGHVNAE